MKDVYQTITDHIINNVDEAGKWVVPWHGVNGTIPRNATTGNTYQGINILNCWVSQEKHSFPTQEWASFKQWQAIGGKIRKGEKGTPIIFYKSMPGKEDGERGYHFAKATHVFNKAQQDGAELASDDIQKLDPIKKIQRIEDWSDRVAQHARIFHTDESRAYYRPSEDKIILPFFNDFKNPERYYATLFHELTHWTGAKHRLDRLFRQERSDYAKEELVAELGAAFLSAEFGIENETREDHTSYIASWLKALKNDKTLIVKAASQASKAVAFLHEATVQQEQAA